MREKLNRASSLLTLYSFLLAAASLLSIPFPFVRQIWIREIWGASGLIYALIFLFVGIRIERSASLMAAAGGLGLIFHEQLIAWWSFFYLRHHGTAHPHDALYLSSSVFISLILGWVLLDAFFSIYRFRRHKAEAEEQHPVDEDLKLTAHKISEEEMPFSVLVVASLGYLIIFALLYATLRLNPAPRYGALKVLGSLACVFSFSGVAQEVIFYIQGKQNRFFCMTKMLTHGIALVAILWVVYHRLPISSVLISG